VRASVRRAGQGGEVEGVVESETRVISRKDSHMADSPGLQKASIAIVWDPTIISPEEYAALVADIGDLVRAHGGVGIERISGQAYAAPPGDQGASNGN